MSPTDAHGAAVSSPQLCAVRSWLAGQPLSLRPQAVEAEDADAQFVCQETCADGSICGQKFNSLQQLKVHIAAKKGGSHRGDRKTEQATPKAKRGRPPKNAVTGESPRKCPRPGFAQPVNSRWMASGKEQDQSCEEQSEQLRVAVQHLMESAAEFQEMLKEQKFGNPELLAIAFPSKVPSSVSGSSTTGSSNVPGIEACLQGIFARRPAPVGGRPCYQKLRKASGKTTSSAVQGIVFANVYIIWCPRSKRWLISSHPDMRGGHCFAKSPIDHHKQAVQELRGPWLISKNWSSVGAAAVDTEGSSDFEQAPLAVVSVPVGSSEGPRGPQGPPALQL